MASTAVSCDLPAPARQAVEDAALAFQLARARRLGDGTGPDRLLFGALSDIQARIRRLCADSREILSVVQRSQSVQEFLPAHRLNRRMLRDGVRMVSLFETRSMSREMLEFLAANDDLPYFCCYGPVQVKVLDGQWVLADGPLDGPRPTVLLDDNREVVRAALGYVHVVRAHASAPADLLRQCPAEPAEDEVLTERQRHVAALLDGGATDEQVAEALDVSVRTVRYEVARILDALQAHNRFGAGRRYGELTP